MKQATTPLTASLGDARRCMAQSTFREARAHAEAALARDPNCLAARLIANQAAFIDGDYLSAMHHVDEGEASHPGRADFALRRARCLIAGNAVTSARTALAEAEVRMAAAEPSDAARLWGMIGDAHALLNDFARAAAAYGRAIAIEPGAALHHFNRAMVERYRGNAAAATADLETVVAVEPWHGEAWLNLVQLRSQTEIANAIAPIEQALARLPKSPVTLRHRIHGLYALAKCHEDLGHGLTSFAHLDAGARLMRKTLRYDVRGDLAMMDLIAQTFRADRPLDLSRGFDGLRPIFVLGMPRSGSTLVERILTSHSQVGTVGESSAFGQAVADVARAAGLDPADGAAVIRASDRLDPVAIGRRYAELTAPWRGPEPWFVDKLPGNHLHVALIARALPEARIIHTVRHPLANLYGLYKTLFNQACPYSYDLDELVDYYGAYCRLIGHWRAQPGLAMIDVSYEALVDRPEPVIRQLIDDCGLEWQPACLTFHKNPRPSTTQSAAQVRLPLNRDGIDGWRRFEPLLTPLRARLDAIGVARG
jgi:tetratricopeptide (TPR) repeat protein